MKVSPKMNFSDKCCSTMPLKKEGIDMENNSKRQFIQQSPIEDGDLWKNYLENRKTVYEQMNDAHFEESLISEANWTQRHMYTSGENLGMHPLIGDICYMDFGQAYLHEIGYQHFAMIMNMYGKKALVIPMTSNAVQYDTAYDPYDNPNGKKHLMRLGRIGNMTKPSVMFLNDIRFVNTARIIKIIAHLDTDSELFWKVQHRMLEVAFIRPTVTFGITRYIR